MEMCKTKNNLDYFIFKWLWAIILLPKPIQLLVFISIIFLLLMRSKLKIKCDMISFLMIALASVHILAILYNIMVFKPDDLRCIGAVNTMILWPIAALYVMYYSNTYVNTSIIGKYCTINLVIMLIPAMITAFMYYGFNIEGFEIFGRHLYGTTYLSEEPTTKFFGFNDFSNINLFYIMFNLMLSLPYLNSKSKVVIIIILGIASFEVFLIHSRLGMVIFTASVLFGFIDTIVLKYRNLILLILIIIAIIIIPVYFREIDALFTDKILYGNEDSTLYRIELLTTSIDKAWEYAPVWGMGIKEVFRPGEDFVAYLGSHSTYIGFFYKTGILGFILGIYIFIKANYKAIKGCHTINNLRMMIMFLVSFIILFAIEDVDGTNWSIFLYFSVLSLLSNKKLKGYE